MINARGTYTIIVGSVMLPEVRAALDAAAQRYVHLDELADAIGARLAALTGAEWGVVTSGCAAALTHAAAAYRASRFYRDVGSSLPAESADVAAPPAA